MSGVSFFAMKKLFTLIITVIFMLNSAGKGLALRPVEGYALRPMAARKSKHVKLNDLDMNSALQHTTNGAYGKVYLAPHKITGKTYVVKVFKSDRSDSPADLFPIIQNQIQIPKNYPQLVSQGLTQRHHEEGVCYFDSGIVTQKETEDGPYAYIVRDYVPGYSVAESLYREQEQLYGLLTSSQLSQSVTLDPVSTRRDFLKDNIALSIKIAEAISAYHNLGLLLKELKPEHIIIRPDGSVSFVDLEGVVPIDYDWEANPSQVSDRVRSMHTNLYAQSAAPFYRAAAYRDIALENSIEFFKAPWDIYNFGLVLFQMIDFGRFLLITAETVGSDREVNDDRCTIEIINYVNYQSRQPELLYGNALLGKASITIYKILKKCLMRYPEAYSPDRYYYDMDSVIKDLRSCLSLLSAISVNEPNASKSPSAGQGSFIFPKSPNEVEVVSVHADDADNKAAKKALAALKQRGIKLARYTIDRSVSPVDIASSVEQYLAAKPTRRKTFNLFIYGRSIYQCVRQAISGAMTWAKKNNGNVYVHLLLDCTDPGQDLDAARRKELAERLQFDLPRSIIFTRVIDDKVEIPTPDDKKVPKVILCWHTSMSTFRKAQIGFPKVKAELRRGEVSLSTAAKAPSAGSTVAIGKGTAMAGSFTSFKHEAAALKLLDSAA